MKTFCLGRLIIIICSIFGLNINHARAQGTVVFRTLNRISMSVDAPVTFLTGERVGAEFMGQLFIGLPEAPLDQLKPLFPTEMFRSGYIIGHIIDVPDFGPGEKAKIVMKAYNGPTWETSSCWGESNPITIFLSSPTQPPSELIGLQPFSVNCIPEPSLLGLLGIGTAAFAAVFGVRTMKKRSGGALGPKKNGV